MRTVGGAATLYKKQHRTAGSPAIRFFLPGHFLEFSVPEPSGKDNDGDRHQKSERTRAADSRDRYERQKNADHADADYRDSDGEERPEDKKDAVPYEDKCCVPR